MVVSEITAIIALLISIVGIYLVVHQLKMTREANEADHKRRKKEATFNAYNAIREDLRELDRSVRDELKLSADDVLTLEQLKIIKDDTELSNKVRTVLSYIQRLAVGIRNDIYDLRVIYELSGTPLIKAFDRYFPRVQSVRKNSETYYQEAEELIGQLRVLRAENLQELSNANTNNQKQLG